MVRRYKIDDEQFFMLTYPTTPDDFPINDLVGILDGLGCNYRIGRELHEDGKPHFHAMVVFDNPYSDRDGRTTFCVGGRSPNIGMRRTKPERGWDYVGKHAGTKDGHYIVAEKGNRPGGDGDSNERSSNDVWHEIILARTREEFFDLASRLAPRQLACSFTQLTSYADWKYRVVETPYASPEVWARSLGAHYYCAGLWDLSRFDESVEYAIFDDMVNGLRAGYFNYKDWLGGQFEFTVQDKYKHKKQIKWGKPAIYICNQDPRTDITPMGKNAIEWDWMEENCVFYECTETIFRANTE
uniref:Replication-associated protein n=1 Tax=Red panda feces-associated gemycircularvirus TaxID=2864013 RepID=A0A8K1HKP3_9VIRU|nr:replication-associated protein [Red panda feces-associated gemycircularvirus]